MRRLLMLSGLALAAATVTGCSTNPVTGQKQFNIVSTSQEVSLGEQSQPDFIKSYGGEVQSPAVTEYVNNLGRRLAANSQRQGMPWEFHVVDSAVLNAFALPGGKVFVTRELLSKLTSESQLAGVVGHEIGHVNAMHIAQEMSRQTLVSVVVAGIGLAAESKDNEYLRTLGLGAQVGGSLYMLKFSRDQESQADELGLDYMSRIGYNPAAMVEVMQILQKESAAAGKDPEFLQTHPYPDTRIERIKAQLSSRYQGQAAASYTADKGQYAAVLLSALAKLPPPAHDPDFKYHRKPAN